MKTAKGSHTKLGREKTKNLDNKIYRLSLPFKKPTSDELHATKLQFQKPFPDTLEAKIANFSASHEISLSNLFLGAFQTLLFRYSRQEDFVIGLKKNHCIGSLHVDCYEKESFLELTSRLERSQDLRSNEPYQVLFSMSCEGLKEVGKDVVDLVFYVESNDGKHNIHVAAARKVFQLETVENMIGHYCQLLENVIDHPHREIDSLAYLTDEEVKLITDFSSGFTEDYPKDMVAFFESQVDEHPENLAITYKNSSLTYSELDRQINQMAHFLHERGVAPGSVVAISSHHDPKMIIGLLALIKLGATYLPLEPTYPKARLEMMIADAKPTVLLAHSYLLEKFKTFSGLKIDIDEEWKTVTKEKSSRLSFEPNLSDPAYLIFTSGSTGKPKGIVISYESLPHLCLERKRYYPNNTVALLSGSISFDVSILTIFHTLMTGGTLCIPDHMEHVDGEALIKHMHKHQVNYFMCVPSFYSMLLEKGMPLPRSLEILSLVGENIPNSLPQLHYKYARHTRLFNEYGPCEIALGCSLAQIYDPLTEEISPIHVGKPLPNTEVYVLDPNLQLVPIGMKGEICVGGAGLAKGYLNQNELTADKFVQVTIPGKPVMRLYRTGDYGRYTPDGNLEFLGRMDYQVKVRGHRIELAEVEAVLCQHKDIDEAIVKVQKINGHQDCLVAYFTTIDKKILSVKELRHFVGGFLPQFEVPSHLMQLKEFPRTPIQKIDRKALPKIPILEEKEITTQENIKDTLAEIWKKVLNLKEVGLNDNFFDVGGNSLLLANIQKAVKDTLKVNVPIIEYFRYSTISGFAKYLESLKNQHLKTVKSS